MNKTMPQIEQNKDNNKEYKVDAICKGKIYMKTQDSSYLSDLYYLVSWKSYLEEKNIWEPALAI